MNATASGLKALALGLARLGKWPEHTQIRQCEDVACPLQTVHDQKVVNNRQAERTKRRVLVGDVYHNVVLGSSLFQIRNVAQGDFPV